MVRSVCSNALLSLLVLRLLLGRSSRSHFVLFESLLILMMGVAFLGIEVVSKVNTTFDQSPQIELRPLITGRFEKRHHRKHGSYHTSYHVRLAPIVPVAGDPPALVPAVLEVPSHIYHDAESGRTLVITTRAGRLGLPWIQAFEIAPAPVGYFPKR